MELEYINGGNVYFDTNIFIYAIEDSEEFRDRIGSLFSRINETNSLVITSELSLAECLVKPFESGNKNSQECYKRYISDSDFLKVEPVSRDILILAAQQRAKLKTKLPDSIHVATALYTKCSILVTNDRIKCPERIKPLILGKIQDRKIYV